MKLLLNHLDLSLDAINRIDLPADFPRKTDASGDKHTVRFQFAKSLFSPLRNVKGNEAYFEGLFSGFALWISKHTRSRHLELAVFSSLNERLGTSKAESFAACVFVDRNEPLVENCVQVIKSLQHSRLEGESRNCNVHFEYFEEHADLKAVPVNHACECAFRVFETGEDLQIEFQLLKNLFSTQTVGLLGQSLENFLLQILQNPYLKLNLVDWVPAEHLQAIDRFNETATNYPAHRTVIDRYEEILAEYGDRDALIFGDQRLSYLAFDQKVNRVANYLSNEGIGVGDVVAVHSERSFDLMVAIFGLLKAGAIYLPIDINQPVNRVTHMLNDAGAKLVLTDEARPTVQSIKSTTVAQLLQVSSNTNFKSLASADAMAYIIYTSGSTGQPKGVMIKHHSLTNRLHWFQNAFPHDCDDVFLQKTSISFDVSVWELIWWSQVGGCLCLAGKDAEKNPNQLASLIEQHEITTIHFVPSMMRVFLDSMERKAIDHELASLKWVFASGEALESSDVTSFQSLFSEESTSLINLYGPTEATIDVTYFDCTEFDARGKVPIGKPIDNTKIHVLDEDLKPLPIGVPGELCISGVQVSVGYLGKEELTREKFVQPPGATDILYKSGDLARWLPDGNIEYLGRFDDQVKIRGYRMELGEISNQLKTHACITDATVLVNWQGSFPQLVAYYIGSKTLTIAEMVRHLQDSLPSYMIPCHFIEMKSFPLTNSGKLDKKSFPLPEVSSVEKFIPANSPLEQQLLEIWGQVLSLDLALIGVNHHFFELGGHSLTFTLLNNLISQEFGTTFSLEEIFERPTIREQAELIQLRDWVKQADSFGEVEEVII